MSHYLTNEKVAQERAYVLIEISNAIRARVHELESRISSLDDEIAELLTTFPNLKLSRPKEGK